MSKMVLEVENGVTMVNKYDDGTYNVQFTPQDSSLEDVVLEFKEFLLACGYSKSGVAEYIEDF